MLSRRVLTAAVVAVCVGAAAGCTASSAPGAGTVSSGAAADSTPGTASSTAANRYRDLLISTADIPVDGLRLKAISSGGATAQGAAAEFVDGTGDVSVTDVVSVFDTPDDAQIALAAAADVAPGQLDDSQTRELTPDGNAYTGTDSGAEVTIAVFTVDRAFVTLRFSSDPSSAIGASAVDAVVAAQAARIRAGLK